MDYSKAFPNHEFTSLDDLSASDNHFCDYETFHNTRGVLRSYSRNVSVSALSVDEPDYTRSGRWHHSVVSCTHNQPVTTQAPTHVLYPPRWSTQTLGRNRRLHRGRRHSSAYSCSAAATAESACTVASHIAALNSVYSTPSSDNNLITMMGQSPSSALSSGVKCGRAQGYLGDISVTARSLCANSTPADSGVSAVRMSHNCAHGLCHSGAGAFSTRSQWTSAAHRHHTPRASSTQQQAAASIGGASATNNQLISAQSQLRQFEPIERYVPVPPSYSDLCSSSADITAAGTRCDLLTPPNSYQTCLTNELNNGHRSTHTEDEVEVHVHMMSHQSVTLTVSANVTAEQLLTSVIQHPQLNLTPIAANIFAIWMCCPLLEVELKPENKPLHVRSYWRHFVDKFTTHSSTPFEHSSDHTQSRDSLGVIISFQRSVFYSKHDETRLKDSSVLQLLYEEAKYNILVARYILSSISDYITLAAIQARIELGLYNVDTHTVQCISARLKGYLPRHVFSALQGGTGSYMVFLLAKLSRRHPVETAILSCIRAFPVNCTKRKLMRRYLHICWSLSNYGCAFFHGQIENPSRNIFSLLLRSDKMVLVAINMTGISVIDKHSKKVLLQVAINKLYWDIARPSHDNSCKSDCLPCLFVQFPDPKQNFSHILQIFSKQAPLMDALLSTMAPEAPQSTRHHQHPTKRSPPLHVSSRDHVDAVMHYASQDSIVLRLPPESAVVAEPGDTVVCTSSVVLATFDTRGRCVRAGGSWSFEN